MVCMLLLSTLGVELGNQKIRTIDRTMKRACVALVVGLLIVAKVSAQIQGVELNMHREMISQRGQSLACQVTCEASGNAVTLESLAIIWTKPKVESANVHTVTKDGKNDGFFSLDGLLGNGTGSFENNNGFLVLDEMDEAICASEHFLCEATFTNPSGVEERAIALSWAREPVPAKSDMHESNYTKSLADLEEKAEHLSTALEMLNMSYTHLLATRQQEKMVQAKILSRLEALEKNSSSSGPPTSPPCDPCANISQTLERLEERIEKIEEMNKSDQKPIVCERGMNETSSEPYYILTDEVLGKDFRCDAQSDGGGWIVFQRREDGSVDFLQKDWVQYRDGFGNLTTEFWLGNEMVYNLTNEHTYELRVDVRTTDGARLYNTYSSFRIESESSLYRLRLGSLSGGTLLERSTAGLSYHKNMAYTTRDRDNDLATTENCADRRDTGSFWHNNCSFVSPNAAWSELGWHNGYKLLKLVFIEMKIRRT
ncbi:ficolin 1 [Elysia marginata]|uniref:Ficolin 1 n=1 Tax=Elysia marginata TaxID=1093978 RepID=A0AAV4FT49_9GAST|nr:ficolin 1 [Elysia marginata]